jgi:hypothetical protein
MGEKCIGNLSSRPVFDGMHLCIGNAFSCNSMQFSGYFFRCHVIEDVRLFIRFRQTLYFNEIEYNAFRMQCQLSNALHLRL